MSGEAQKLITLLNIHFPELEREYKKVNNARSDVIKYLNVDNKICVNDFIKSQEFFESESKSFKNEIALLAKRIRDND